MEPIAVVHWTDACGWDKKSRCYDTEGLNAIILGLQQKNYVYIVCMMSVMHPLPTKKPRRYRQTI